MSIGLNVLFDLNESVLLCALDVWRVIINDNDCVYVITYKS